MHLDALIIFIDEHLVSYRLLKQAVNGELARRHPTINSPPLKNSKRYQVVTSCFLIDPDDADLPFPGRFSLKLNWTEPIGFVQTSAPFDATVQYCHG
jgi:hypothetical protein